MIEKCKCGYEWNTSWHDACPVCKPELVNNLYIGSRKFNGQFTNGIAVGSAKDIRKHTKDVFGHF
jgi:hypothetical protein